MNIWKLFEIFQIKPLIVSHYLNYILNFIKKVHDAIEHVLEAKLKR